MTYKAHQLTGRTFGTLTVIERAGITHSHVTWLCTCTCGNTVTKRGTYLLSGQTATCGDRDAHPTAKPGQRHRSYSRVHDLIRERGGRATDHQCTTCPDQAQVWAFLGCDTMIVGPGGTNPYCPSAHADEYAPMCRHCARLADRVVRDHVQRHTLMALAA